MVYFTPPDAPPAVVYQAAATAEPASVQANTTSIRRVEYGVCRGIKAVEKNRVLDEWQVKANTLTPTMYAIDLLSKNKRDGLRAVGGSANVDWEWYNKWEKSLKVSILRPPVHAQLGDPQQDINLPIVPNTDYFGKDRVDLLVQGKDDFGRPFALTLRYYLTVLNETEERRIYGGKDMPFKELCGKNHNRWRISGLGEIDYGANTVGNLAAWQRSADLSALIASTQQNLTGFTDLPATPRA